MRDITIDVALSRAFKDNETVSICLNGYKLIIHDTNILYNLGSKGVTLQITDCKGTGSFDITGTNRKIAVGKGDKLIVSNVNFKGLQTGIAQNNEGLVEIVHSTISDSTLTGGAFVTNTNGNVHFRDVQVKNNNLSNPILNMTNDKIATLSSMSVVNNSVKNSAMFMMNNVQKVNIIGGLFEKNTRTDSTSHGVLFDVQDPDNGLTNVYVSSRSAFIENSVYVNSTNVSSMKNGAAFYVNINGKLHIKGDDAGTLVPKFDKNGKHDGYEVIGYDEWHERFNDIATWLEKELGL